MPDISYAIRLVNRYSRLMQIVAGNANIFADGFNIEYSGVSMHFYGDNSAKEMAAGMRQLRRFIPGSKVEKNYTDYYFQMKLVIPPTNGDTETHITFSASRKTVCKAVETGTEMVEEIDYEKAPKKMVEKPIIEWQCDPILSEV